MNLFLLKILFIALPAAIQPQVSADTCYCHGKFYVRINGATTDSVNGMEALGKLKQIENSGQRVEEKEHLLDIIKYNPCRVKK